MASLQHMSVHNIVGIVNLLSVFLFAHPSDRRNWRKQYTPHNQNPMWRSSKTSGGRDGLMLRSSQVFVLHCCLFWKHFSWRFSQLVSRFVHRCLYSPACHHYHWFSSTLVINSKCLHYFLGLIAKDVVQAVSDVQLLTSSLKKVRENVNSHHSEGFWYV